jgi:voltage-gated potassium channel
MPAVEHRLVSDRATAFEHRFEAPIIVATLLMIPVLLLQGADVGEPWRAIAYVADWLIWAMFAAEVVVMLAVVPSRRRWLAQHPLDVAIVVLTPPVISGLMTSIRLLRLVRLFRLLRVAQLARGVFSLAGVRYAALLAALTAIAGGQAFASAEHVSDANGFYWAVTTMTTVGYGDLKPMTETGKIIAVVVMLVGIGFVAVLTGAIAQRFIAPAEDRAAYQRVELDTKLDDLAARLERIEARVGDEP